MEPDAQRERGTPGKTQPEAAWSPYDEAAAQEESEWRQARRRRGWLITGVLGTVLLVAIAAGGYLWYDRATQPDRNTPGIVVEQYVNTFFEDRNPDSADAFECNEGDAADRMKELLAEIEGREENFGIIVKLATANYSTSIVGNTAEVAVDFRIDVPEEDGKMSRSTQRWKFQLRDEDGWLICNAERLG